MNFIKVNGEVLQVHPIHKGTFQGIAIDLSCSEKQTDHCQADGDVTFSFSDGTNLIIAMVMGQDLGITEDVASITSTGSVLVS